MDKSSKGREQEKQNTFRAYCRENMPLLGLGPLLIGIILLVGYLYSEEPEAIGYLILFTAVIHASTVWLQYRREQSRKAKEVPVKDDSEELAAVWEKFRQQQDFFGMWAHQIKTPIAALNLLLRAQELDVPACKGEVFKIERYVEMVLGYLRFGEMRNDLDLVKCEVEPMVRQVVKKFATLFIAKHLSINLRELDHTILTDEKWFSFVLEQIISNAVKYTNTGGITIYCEYAAQERESRDETLAGQDGRDAEAVGGEGSLRLIIEDTGIGIRSEDLPRLFHKGFTGYNGRADKKASGLGLYLCKGVCDKLGHKISIESAENQGTKVILTICEDHLSSAELAKN